MSALQKNLEAFGAAGRKIGMAQNEAERSVKPEHVEESINEFLRAYDDSVAEGSLSATNVVFVMRPNISF